MLCLAVIDHGGTPFTNGGTRFNNEYQGGTSTLFTSEYCPRRDTIFTEI